MSYTIRRCCMPGCLHAHIYEDGEDCRALLSVSVYSVDAGRYLLEQTLDLDPEETERLIARMLAIGLPETLPSDVEAMDDWLTEYLHPASLDVEVEVTVIEFEVVEVSDAPPSLDPPIPQFFQD